MRRLVCQESRLSQVLESIGDTSALHKSTHKSNGTGQLYKALRPRIIHSSLNFGDMPEEKRDDDRDFHPRESGNQTVRPLRPFAHPPWGTLSEQLSDALIGLNCCPGSISLTESLLRRDPRPQNPQ